MALIAVGPGPCIMQLVNKLMIYRWLRLVFSFGPGSLRSDPGVPGYTHFLVRGSISFLTRRKISSNASAILFNCVVSIFLLSVD